MLVSPTAQGQIPEWAKTLITTSIGAAVGFISAIAAEVWKFRRSTLMRAGAMRRALYSEIGEMYRIFDPERTLFDDGDFRPNMFYLWAKEIRIDAYEFAKSNPDVFYTLKDTSTINEIYSLLNSAQRMAGMESKEIEVSNLIYRFLQAVAEAVEHNRIDVVTFKEATPESFQLISAAIRRHHDKLNALRNALS